MKASSFKFLFIGVAILIPITVSFFMVISHYYRYQEQKKALALYEPTYKELTFPEMNTVRLPTLNEPMELSRDSVKKKAVKQAQPITPQVKQKKVKKEKIKEESGRLITAETVSKNRDSLKVDNLDLSELSPELAARFEAAIKNSNNDAPSVEKEERDYSVSQLEKDKVHWEGRLPPLNFQTHNYTSDINRRWVRVNGKEFAVGDMLNKDIKLLEINPRDVLIEFQEEKIKIPSLYDWKG